MVILRHPSLQGWVRRMDDRDELRRLIDVIEKASSSVQLDQAIEDIKTFSKTASFLANKLETRLKGGDVKPKGKLVLSRLRSGLSTHLCGLSLKCQGAFAA